MAEKKVTQETGSCEKDQLTKKEEPIVKPTWYRYLILFLYCINTGNKTFQYTQISASTKKLSYYYQVDNYVINTTSIVFMISFIILSIPACYLIEQIGLRKAVILGSLGTALGSLIKCFSCNNAADSYLVNYEIHLLFLGLIVVSLSEQFIFSIPSKLASVWFPDHQVSSAVSICILGQIVGESLGFLIPQTLLESRETRESIGELLYNVFYYTTIMSVISLIADIILFHEGPKYPPGKARLEQILNKHSFSDTKRRKGFLYEIKSLLMNMLDLLKGRDFALLAMSYGINIGIVYTVPVLLNQMLEPLWPNDDNFIGDIGFLIVAVGVIGALIWGPLLDKTRKYLMINIFLTLMTAASFCLLIYTMCVIKLRRGTYLAGIIFGFFQVGLIVGGLEFAVELTYPAGELISSSLLNLIPQIVSIATIYLGSFIVDSYGTLALNLFYLICTLIALILLINIKEVLKRQEALKSSGSPSANTTNMSVELGEVN